MSSVEGNGEKAEDWGGKRTKVFQGCDVRRLLSEDGRLNEQLFGVKKRPKCSDNSSERILGSWENVHKWGKATFIHSQPTTIALSAPLTLPNPFIACPAAIILALYSQTCWEVKTLPRRTLVWCLTTTWLPQILHIPHVIEATCRVSCSTIAFTTQPRGCEVTSRDCPSRISRI